jgi:hypothetical protein
MTQFQKIVGVLMVACGLMVALQFAWAASSFYKYTDVASSNFFIKLWGPGCGSDTSPEYCTGMVLEDSSGAEKGTSANPISTSETAAQGTAGSAAPSKGLFVGGIYNSSAPSPSNGQYEPFQLDASGRVIVSCGSGCGGSGGTSIADESAFTWGTTSLTPGGGFYQTTATNNPLTNGQVGAWQMTAYRAGFVNLRNSAGAEIGTSGVPVYVQAPFDAFVDGWNATEGTKGDSAATDNTSSWSVIALLKGIWGKLATIATNTGAAVPSGTATIGNVGAGVTPAGATASNGSTTGTTGATSTTLAAVSAVTENVCWISIRANAAAAATGNATLSDGTKTFNFTQWTAPSASGLGVTEEIFNPCIPASATNTAWTLTSAAPGTSGAISVAMGGWYK